MFRLDELTSLLDAEHIGPTKGVILEVVSDSRVAMNQALFVALRGENFDGHEFVNTLAGKGAIAAIVDKRWWQEQSASPAITLFVVADTQLALLELGRAWRLRHDIRLIAVTGSNGKTTTKEMCAAILRVTAARLFDAKDAVLATEGNLNNQIGVPKMLLRLNEGHRFAVIEMGMNQPGEIALLTSVAAPDVALVTNAQRAHLQGMGSLQEIAEEKGEIYGGLDDDGVAIINIDDGNAELWRSRNHRRQILTYSLNQDADVRGTAETVADGLAMHVQIHAKNISFNMPVLGVHNASNAVGAIAACSVFGATLDDVATALGNFTGAKGRLQRKAGLNGALIIDDTYNANPDSVRAAIDVLAAMPGKTILVLGDMGEIGGMSAQLHDETGGYAKSHGVDIMLTMGEVSELASRNFGDNSQHFSDSTKLNDVLRPMLEEGVVVLIKGSRFMKMERVVDMVVAVK